MQQQCRLTIDDLLESREASAQTKKNNLNYNEGRQCSHSFGRGHYDVYYVYHNAAATSLAEGDLQAYRNHVRAGSKELDSLEAKLKDVLKKSSGDDHRHQTTPYAGSGAL